MKVSHTTLKSFKSFEDKANTNKNDYELAGRQSIKLTIHKGDQKKITSLLRR